MDPTILGETASAIQKNTNEDVILNGGKAGMKDLMNAGSEDAAENFATKASSAPPTIFPASRFIIVQT
jgi:hypothetical protein